MDTLKGFEEIAVDRKHSEIRVPVMHLELSYEVRYFINNSGVGYCSLLTREIKGKGLRGKIEAAAAKPYVGRYIIVFISELDDGKKLITIPALFEKEPSFDDGVDLSDFVLNAYYHDDLKKTPEEVYIEHMNALVDKKISSDLDLLRKDILELPGKGIEILQHSQ